jgi:hypothetical protein
MPIERWKKRRLNRIRKDDVKEVTEIGRLQKEILMPEQVATKKREREIDVRFQVPTAAIMKFRVLWDVAPCSHIEVDRRFRGVYCLHYQ